MADVLESTAAHLSAALARAQREGRMPSLVAAVVRDGAVVWSGCRGRVAGEGAAPTPDTQYRVGSITKTMTAAMVMQLRDADALDLQDPVGAHVPEAPYADRTIRSLLSHSSGMRAEPVGDWWERTPGVGWSELAAAHADAAGVLPPGRQFHYSNLGYAVLGELVSRLRGCTWREAVETQLLRPIGLTRTSYDPMAPHAEGYSVHAFAGTLTDEPAHDTGAMAPAGQLWSTVGDLGRWLAFLLGPDPDVLSPESVAEMRTPQSGAPEAALEAGYGLGLDLVRLGDVAFVGHGGSMPGFLAGMFGDPARRVGAVLLANGTAGLDGRGLLRSLVETLVVHEPQLDTEWVPTSSVDPGTAELLGLWHWGNTAYTLSVEGDGLLLDGLQGGRQSRLRQAGADTFVGQDGYFTGETMHVVRRGDRTISHLDVATFVLTRLPYDPEAPIPGGVSGR